MVVTFNCDYVRRQDGRILRPLGLNLTSDAPWKAIYISTHTEYGLYIFASLCYLPFLLISISFFYFYECQCVRICFTNLYRMTSIGLDHTYRHTYTWRLESCVCPGSTLWCEWFSGSHPWISCTMLVFQYIFFLIACAPPTYIPGGFRSRLHAIGPPPPPPTHPFCFMSLHA